MPPKYLRRDTPHTHKGEEPELVELNQPPPVPDDAPACQMCSKQGVELRPFGPNHESICEACSEKDPEMTELRWREMNPDG